MNTLLQLGQLSVTYFFLVYVRLEAFKPFEGSNIFQTTDKAQNNPILEKKQKKNIPNHPKCKSYMAGWLSTQVLFFGKFHAPTSSDLLYHARNQDQPARHVDATVWVSVLSLQTQNQHTDIRKDFPQAWPLQVGKAKGGRKLRKLSNS